MFTGISDLYGWMNSQTLQHIGYKNLTEHGKHQTSEDSEMTMICMYVV